MVFVNVNTPEHSKGKYTMGSVGTGRSDIATDESGPIPAAFIDHAIWLLDIHVMY